MLGRPRQLSYIRSLFLATGSLSSKDVLWRADKWGRPSSLHNPAQLENQRQLATKLPPHSLPPRHCPGQEQNASGLLGAQPRPLSLSTLNRPHTALPASLEASSSLLTLRETGCRSIAIAWGWDCLVVGPSVRRLQRGDAQSCLRNDLEGSSWVAWQLEAGISGFLSLKGGSA